MYICLCHAISDQDVRDAQALGVSDVFAHFAVAPSCGRCSGTMDEMIRPCSRHGKSDGDCPDHDHCHDYETVSPISTPTDMVW